MLSIFNGKSALPIACNMLHVGVLNAIKIAPIPAMDIICDPMYISAFCCPECSVLYTKSIMGSANDEIPNPIGIDKIDVNFKIYRKG